MRSLRAKGSDVNLLALSPEHSTLPEVSMYYFLLIVLFLIFTAPVSQAQTSNSATSSETNGDEDSHISANRNRAIKGGRANFVLSRIDTRVIRELARAWDRSEHGIKSHEAIVLISRMTDDSLKAVAGRHTNEAYQLTFEWNQAIIAIVHTHPNKSDPKPQGPDRLIADRFGVPMFTITLSGMYLYDPATRKTTKVHEGLDWLSATSWERYSQRADIQLASR